MRRVSIIPVLLTAVVGALSFHDTNAQADSVAVAHSVERLTLYWKSIEQPRPQKKPAGNITEAEKLFRFHGMNSTVQSGYDPLAYNQAKADYLRKDYGLQVNAGYVENFNTAVNAEDNLIYVRRLQAGINWNVLSGGFIENRYRARSLELDNELQQMFPYDKIHDVTFTERWNLTLYLFNLKKIALLNQRETVVKNLLQEEQALFHQKFLSYENLLQCETRYAEILSLKTIYEKFNERLDQAYKPGVDSMIDWELPMLEADYVALTQGTLPAYIDSAYSLIHQKIALDYSWWNDVSLTPYIRYNYYDITNANSLNRNFVSAGVNMGVPITFRKKEKEELMQLEFEKTRDRLIFREENGSKELLTDYYEYEYKLKQYVSFHQKRLRFIELFRQETARFHLDPVSFNPVKALELYDDILSIENEMLDLQQNLYLKLLRISQRKGDEQISHFCRTLNLPDHLENYFREEKSAYLWSRSYVEGQTDFLSEYIRFQQFGRVAVSTGSDARSKTLALTTVRSLRRYGIKTELLVGNNNLTPDNAIQVLNEALQGTDTLFTGIHLDYEPHTFADWDQKKSTYLTQFEKILVIVSEYCRNKKLELRISIPLHYPAESVQSFLSYCDGIVFMAYENVKTSYLLNKLSPFADKPEKVFVAFRTEDFANRNEMESFLQEFGAATGLNRFYIHDVARCMQWDAGTVGGKP